MVYEALDGELGRKLALKTLRPARRAHELSEDWLPLVRRCLALDPSSRPPSGQAVAAPHRPIDALDEAHAPLDVLRPRQVALGVALEEGELGERLALAPGVERCGISAAVTHPLDHVDGPFWPRSSAG